MTSRTHAMGLLCFVLFTGWASEAQSQDMTSPACVERTFAELAHAERILRSVVIGQKAALGLSVGAVRYDQERIAWTKTAADTWRTLQPGMTNATRTDAQMDASAEFPARKGLLEQRQAMMSQDIAIALPQALRAFQCHTRAICDAQRASQTSALPTVTVQPAGCIAYSLPRFDACMLTQPAALTGGDPIETGYANISIHSCNAVRDQLVEHERQVLLMLANYDASYRVLLQMGGMFQDVLSSFRVSILTPLWQTVRIMDRFGGVSCFNAQCDE